MIKVGDIVLTKDGLRMVVRAVEHDGQPLERPWGKDATAYLRLRDAIGDEAARAMLEWHAHDNESAMVKLDVVDKVEPKTSELSVSKE
jgi:hypothetical protein